MAHIKTFCRIKPTRTTFKDYQISTNTLHIQVPENLRDGTGDSNIRQRPVTNHQFKFTYVFKEDASQEDVFNRVAKDIVDGFLAGYNGTIFAYGQTGTGKTYTVEGSARRYQDRGLAPRAISMIYNALASRQAEEIDIHVSYMEIYQEVGYDLLTPAARLGTIVTSFPKVSVVEGPQGSCVIRNLTQHLAASEDVAQSLLIEGQANRQVAETSMNQRSSRSHAIFTIQLSVKKPGDDIIIRSKLHLVDLAGSERVSKTRIEGQQLAEAKYINLSLHHLESVIIALQQKATAGKMQLPTPNFMMFNRWVNSQRAQNGPTSANPLTQATQQTRHIPYRNSLLTMVLRDSLGGNCQTAMIATITFEEDSLGETISTCRFAQRVACITNVVSKNEELDDKSLIRRLRRCVAELESEVALLREGLDLPANVEGSRTKLTEDEKLEIVRIVQSYLLGRVTDPITAGIKTPTHFRECLRLLKKMILQHYVQDNNDRNMKVVLDARAQKSITAAAPPSQSTHLPPVSPTTSTSSRSPSGVPASTVLTTVAPTRPQEDAVSKGRSHGQQKQAVRSEVSHHATKPELTGQRDKTQQKFPSFDVLLKRRSQLEKKQLEGRTGGLQLQKKEQRGSDLSTDSDQSQDSRALQSHLLSSRSTRLRAKPVQNGVSNSPGGDTKQHGPQHTSGRVNSRQVMEQLKAEDKSLKKTKKDLLAEKTFARSQEIALKEAATRQRLLEFKEKLRQAKAGAFTAKRHDSSSEHSQSGVDVMTKPQIPSQKSAFTETRHPSSTKSSITAVDMPSNIVEVEKPSSPNSVSEGPQFNHDYSEIPTNGHAASQFDSASVISLAGSVSPYRYEKESAKPTQRQPSQPTNGLSFLPASRAPSICSKNAHELELMYLERKRNISEMWGVESTRQSTLANTPVVPDFVGGNISRLSRTPISSVPVPDQGYEDTPRVSDVFRRTESELSFDIGRSNSETDICDAEVRQVFLENGDGDADGNDDVAAAAADDDDDDDGDEYVKPERDPPTKLPSRGKAEVSQPNVLVSRFLKQDGAKRNTSAEVDFSHKDFDKALQKMLGTDMPPTLSYTHEDYDKFARPVRPVKTPRKSAKASNRAQSALSTAKPEMAADNNKKPKPFNPWGPEARGMTVGERIARLVKEAARNQSVNKSESDSFIPPPSPEFSDATSHGISTNGYHATRSNHNKPSVKALGEKERETTYMSSMKAERLRLARIQRARSAAEVIQRSWRRYKNRHK